MTTKVYLTTQPSPRHRFLYRNSGFRTKMGELIILNWMVMESRDLANERQRIAGSGDGVLARLCCRVVTEMVLLHPGWLRCFNVAWLQRNQQISGSRFLTMCDFSQCVAHWRGSAGLRWPHESLRSLRLSRGSQGCSKRAVS